MVLPRLRLDPIAMRNAPPTRKGLEADNSLPLVGARSYILSVFLLMVD